MDFIVISIALKEKIESNTKEYKCLKKILKRELCISLGVTDDYLKWYYLSIHVHNLPVAIIQIVCLG